MQTGHSYIPQGRIRSYRFGFNGQEKDNDLYGEGNAYAFEYRIHDPRLGRFLSVDPVSSTYPWNSPYAFAENDVLRFIDLEGLETPSTPSTVKSDGIYTTAIDNTNTAGIFDHTKEPVHSANKIPTATVGASGGEGDSKQFKYNLELYGPWVLPFYDVSKKLIKGDRITWLDIGIEAAGFIPFGKVVGKAYKVVAKSEFAEGAVKELVTFFKNNVDESTDVIIDRLNKGVKSHEKRIVEHTDWIANPKLQYGDEWDNFSQARKDREINHWKQDIKRNEAYRDAKKEAAANVAKDGNE